MPALTAENIRLIGSSQQLIRVRINAGKSQQFPGYGNRYYCKELYNADSNAGVSDIEIQTDLTSRRPLNVGIGEAVPEGSYYEVLTLFNPLAVPIYIELYSGFGEIIDNRLNIVRERPAYSQPVIDSTCDIIAAPAQVAAAYILAAGATLVLDGIPPTGYFQRRAFTVANTDPNLSIQIVDEAGSPVGVVFKESTQVYYLSGEVGVKNNNGTPITVYVGEVWYRNYGT